MSYDVTKLVKLAALKALAEKVNSDYATKVYVEELSGKLSDIDVPTKISQLANDKNYQTDSEVAAAIATAIAEIGHASFKTIDSIPTVEDAEDNVLYLVMNSQTQHYDIYAKIDTEVVLLDDTTVDLSDYVKTADIDTALANKVDIIEGKGLSSNDFTTDEKNKLTDIAANATKVESSTTNGNVKINGAEVVIYAEPDDIVHGEIATDSEINEMLVDVFSV